MLEMQALTNFHRLNESSHKNHRYLPGLKDRCFAVLAGTVPRLKSSNIAGTI